jgi:hypothetical protein
MDKTKTSSLHFCLNFNTIQQHTIITLPHHTSNPFPFSFYSITTSFKMAKASKSAPPAAAAKANVEKKEKKSSKAAPAPVAAPAKVSYHFHRFTRIVHLGSRLTCFAGQEEV